MQGIALDRNMKQAPRVTGLILAGGMSRRMQEIAGDAKVAGSVDKALLLCAGKPLIAWTLERLRPQVDALLINCNRNLAAYAALGCRLLADRRGGFAGPLAGMHAALYELNQEGCGDLTDRWLLSVPCDCPFFPEDLAQSMIALATQAIDLVVASCPQADQTAEQPVFLLMRPRLLASLEVYLNNGGRKIDSWYQSLNYVSCYFDESSAFRNINTPHDLKVAESLLGSPHLDCDALEADLARLGQAQQSESSAAGPMIPIEALKKALIERLRPIDRRQWISLERLAGQVLAQNLFSPFDVPSHQNTAMDGFALRFKDLEDKTSSDFVIGARILAGHPALKPPPQNPHALRVMTGAVLPEGFDVVVPQELCRLEGERVWIPAGQEQGQHVRLAGEDLRRGELAIASGTRLSAIHLGLMASLGITKARVRGPLKVAILSTGDEVIDPVQGKQRSEGQLFDSNRYMLRALLAKWPSLAIHDAGIVADDPKRLEAVLRALSESHDVIISSGGVSVGEADFTRDMMAGLGKVQFCTVAMRPGRPLALGRVGRALYIGLPGNPVAVAMTFWYFVAPAINRLLGLGSSSWPLQAARAGQRIRKKPGRTEFQRARLDVDERGDCLLFVSSNQGSGVLSSLTKYPVIAVLEHDRGTIEPGDKLSYVRIDDLLN